MIELTGDSVHLLVGVVVKLRFWLVRGLIDRSCSWGRDVGNLQGQSGLVETEITVR